MIKFLVFAVERHFTATVGAKRVTVGYAIDDCYR